LDTPVTRGSNPSKRSRLGCKQSVDHFFLLFFRNFLFTTHVYFFLQHPQSTIMVQNKKNFWAMFHPI
jgi:hypothetical protein